MPLARKLRGGRGETSRERNLLEDLCGKRTLLGELDRQGGASWEGPGKVQDIFPQGQKNRKGIGHKKFKTEGLKVA